MRFFITIPAIFLAKKTNTGANYHHIKQKYFTARMHHQSLIIITIDEISPHMQTSHDKTHLDDVKAGA